jgi:hypothetical protein
MERKSQDIGLIQLNNGDVGLVYSDPLRNSTSHAVLFGQMGLKNLIPFDDVKDNVSSLINIRDISDQQRKQLVNLILQYRSSKNKLVKNLNQYFREHGQEQKMFPIQNIQQNGLIKDNSNNGKSLVQNVKDKLGEIEDKFENLLNRNGDNQLFE